ncbi:MAG TPA: hypothetical protein VE736_05265 [Gaiellaceae bacterium]|jgi:hypothetical protein|nr:hypothetical protein [Gaiellaceae bacterium]
MRRSVATVLGIAGGMAAASAFVRRRGALREHVDVYYEDGSMLSLTNGSPDAEQLIPLAREILRRTR